MPGRFLTTAERKKLERFPDDISSDDIISHFTLTDSDMAQMPVKSAEHNILGFALQLCVLRFTGFCPTDLCSVPASASDYVSGQIGISSQAIRNYGQRSQTRTGHLQKIQDYLGFRKAGSQDLKNTSKWLAERALEHDSPALLLRMLCEKLLSEKIIRPGTTVLERMVVSARLQAHEETYRRLEFLLNPERKKFLDSILIPDEAKGRTPFFRLRSCATANTPSDILKTAEKLDYLRKNQVDRWDMTSVNPNRRKFLAHLGRRSTNQSLQRAVPQRRYPILAAFLQQTYHEVIDELVELFDRCLGDCYTRSKRDLKEFFLANAKTANEKLRLLIDIGYVIFDSGLSGDDLKEEIYRVIPENEFRIAVEECSRLIRPKDDRCYDFLGNRYSYIREFSPKFLDALKFRSGRQEDSLLKALDILRTLNASGTRKVPDDAPVDFMQNTWLPYIKTGEGKISRRYYEIGTLWHLRSDLRSGDIWVEDSRRYADPETYLIPKEQWLSLKTEACCILGLPEEGAKRIGERQHELEAVLQELDDKITGKDGVRIENGDMIVSPLKAEELPAGARGLQNLIAERLPHADLADILIEVDSWVRFSDHFRHASTQQPVNTELLANLYASVLAQANNHGLTKMAEISGLSYAHLVWHTNWFIRDETLQGGINALVNYQFHQPLAGKWGGGAMSSSDGQRFPVAVKARNSFAIPRYYGYERILTFHSWSSDQHSQWRCKPAPPIHRDATYILDGILDNETELPLFEHTSDTAGFTELIFALFDLLGFVFSPRIRDMGNQHIYCIDKNIRYKNLDQILKGTVSAESVLNLWDTVLRIAASIKFGWVSASLFVSKLQSQSRQSSLAKALREYGRLIKSIYIPKYICREEQQRKVSLQLNRGEALHSLRRWLMFAEEGQIRKSQPEDQANQASSLTLVTNAIIVWNTRYMQAAIDQIRQEGHDINDDDLQHISPCRFEHINKHGRLTFNVEREWSRKTLRPLRDADTKI